MNASNSNVPNRPRPPRLYLWGPLNSDVCPISASFGKSKMACTVCRVRPGERPAPTIATIPISYARLYVYYVVGSINRQPISVAFRPQNGRQPPLPFSSVLFILYPASLLPAMPPCLLRSSPITVASKCESKSTAQSNRIKRMTDQPNPALTFVKWKSRNFYIPFGSHGAPRIRK